MSYIDVTVCISDPAPHVRRIVYGPAEGDRPKARVNITHDLLVWAYSPDALRLVAAEFSAAADELARVIEAGSSEPPDERTLAHEADAAQAVRDAEVRT